MRIWPIALIGLAGCTSEKSEPVSKKSISSNESQSEISDQIRNSRPWQTDRLLKDRLHPDYPNDLQVIVHDGGPRLTTATPELMWVTVTGTSGRAYRGKLLNEPHNLTSIKQGDEILFLATKADIEPFRVTSKYLEEREQWHVAPCSRCGMPELFDAPSDLIKVIFPDIPTSEDRQETVFTTFCPLCGGIQFVSDKPIDPAELK